MKKILILISIFLFDLLLLFADAEADRTWHVSNAGNDANSGSVKYPFQTIQHAIDSAMDGDIIIVMEGRYTGQGNTNINFHGKAITVRSLNPDDNECVRATIIDAKGQGVIVRFVNDEGPDSVFSGFTLIAGDISLQVRGVPGFFEFSDMANPTTIHLRIGGEGSLPADYIEHSSKGNEVTNRTVSGYSAETGSQSGSRIWDGNDPFHQPFSTTDYHGSGDVDADGTLTENDLLLAQKMADGLTRSSTRADVDGNKVINADDISLIGGALNGGGLPAWWNSLKNREERNFWVDKILAIDMIDNHPYYPIFFKCGHFSAQLFINAAGYREDLFWTIYTGGPTLFNLPMYDVTVSAPSFGHGINAILVGDDALDFDAWRFIEPQNDFNVYPGRWNMPYNSSVEIQLPYGRLGYCFGDCPDELKIRFKVESSGWALDYIYSSEFLTQRPALIPQQASNEPDLWNPKIVPIASPLILLERSRNDMSRMTDIHLSDLKIPFIDRSVDNPLILGNQYSRLLDVKHAPDGTIHILWKGKPEYNWGVFHGELDPIKKTIKSVTRVASECPVVRMGKIIITPSNEIHAFWLDGSFGFSRGINWSRLTEYGWQTKQNLTPGIVFNHGYPGPVNRDLVRYFFDCTVADNGDIVLVWISGSSDETEVREIRYDGTWGSPSLIDRTNARGVNLITDSAGTIHLLYWLGIQQSYSLEGSRGRGIMAFRKYDGTSWSDLEILDDSGDSCCPRMAAGTEGEVYMIWERKEGDRVIPIWNKYENGMWHDPQRLDTRPGTDAWYPTLEVLPNTAVVGAWSSRSPDRVTIETEILVQPLVKIKHVSTETEDYSISEAVLGSKPYTDRNYEITGISSGIDEGVLVRTANDDKYVTAEDHLVLLLLKDAAVYVCYDNRCNQNLPVWLRSWTLTDELISTTDRAASPMLVFRKTVKAGDEITLGGNHNGGDTGARSNYFVIAKPKVPADIVEITYVSSEKPYTTAVAELGANPYIDRNYEISNLTEGLQESVIVCTSNDDKNVAVEQHLGLRMTDDVIVYVAYDRRGYDPFPCWLDGWHRSIQQVSTSDAHASPMVLFSRCASAGTEIFLGGNHYCGGENADSNYFVMVQPLSSFLRIEQVSNDKPYDLVCADVGMQPYIDRSYTITELNSGIPNLGLKGGVMIRTANDDKLISTEKHLKIAFNQEVNMLACYDGRALSVPDWMQTWQAFEAIVATTDRAASPMNVYRQHFTPSSVWLGGNHDGGDTGARSNYFVVVQP